MPVLNTQISISTDLILNRLVKNLGYTKRLIVELAIRDFYRSESKLRKERPMPGWLFDLFVGHHTSAADVAAMDQDTIERQIGEMRADEPDDIDMTDAEIAQAIHDYAAQDG